jgi:hypothetical protein
VTGASQLHLLAATLAILASRTCKIKIFMSRHLLKLFSLSIKPTVIFFYFIIFIIFIIFTAAHLFLASALPILIRSKMVVEELQVHQIL